MEPTSLLDDAEFSLPLEFLTDDDFLMEKENKAFKGDEYNKCLFPYEHGFGSTVKPIGEEEKLLAGLARKTVQSSLEDDCSGGFCGNDAKAWGSTRCGADGRRNPNCQTRFSSQAVECDLYCAAAEELSVMNINGYTNHNGRGLLDLPRKHPLAAAKISNDGYNYYSRQSLQYQKLHAIQFQQLKQRQLIKHRRRGLSVNNNEVAGSVDLSPSSAWSNHPQRRDGSGMRDVFLGNCISGKSGSTGTGVFLPRRVTPATTETCKKTMVATVLVPARPEEILNLDESLVQSSFLFSPSLNDASWRQRSNNGGFSSQMKIDQPVNEPQLPPDWAY